MDVQQPHQLHQQDIELRSEEVQEILGTPPSWLVRWGTLLVGLILAAMVALAWWVKYPDVLRAPVSLTAAVPPVKVYSRVGGYLSQMFVSNGSTVQANDVLAVIQNTAQWEDIVTLEKELARVSRLSEREIVSYRPPKQLSLGALQADYSFFITQFENFLLTKNVKISQLGTAPLHTQISKLQKSIANEQQLKSSAESKWQVTKDWYKRQQQLYADRNISLQELENARLKLTDAEDAIKYHQQAIYGKEIEIEQINGQLNTLRSTNDQRSVITFVQIQTAIAQLQTAITHWKQQYLVVAPIAGKVALRKDIATKYYVNPQEELLSIIPALQDTAMQQIVGHIRLPIAGSGKAKVGQKVWIQLDSYPYQEFGKLKATVQSKGLVPESEGYYLLIVTFDNGLRTDFGKLIEFQPQLSGTAAIITDNKRFLLRLVENFRKVTAQG